MEVVGLIWSTVAIAERVANTFYRYNEVAEAKILLLSIDISLLRLQQWQHHWFKQDKFAGSRSEELWGKDGSERIQETIVRINQQVVQLGETLGKVSKKATNTSNGKIGVELPPELTKEVDKAFRDMDQRKRGHRRFVRFFKFFNKSMIQSLRKPTLDLSLMVDQLEQLSQLSFQTVHGLQTPKNYDGFRTYVLRSVLSRQGALNLWQSSRCDIYQCSLGIDMLLDKGVVTPLHVAIQSDGNGALCYRLLWAMDERYIFMKLTDTGHPNRTTQRPDSDGQTVESRIHDLIPQKAGDQMLVKATSKYSKQASRFQVEEINNQISLSDIARFSASQGDKEAKKPLGIDLFTSLTVKEKIRLAYKLTECGAELLGTPWFASVLYSEFDRVRLQGDSSKMQQGKGTLQHPSTTSSELEKVDPKQVHSLKKDTYILDAPRIRIDDMIVQDSGILAEHHQLFSLGVLLVRLALGCKVAIDPEAIRDQTTWASEVLPLVSRELGNQYAEACAFCVGVPRKGHWESLRADKYARTKELDSWREYLERFIGDFYSEVYLRCVAISISLRPFLFEALEALE